MRKPLLNLGFTFLGITLGFSQTLLNANEPGNTYEDINAVLAPGYNAVETPDCAHADFGRHINEVFDTELNTYVFQFIAHKTPDNDRCKKFDRQRVEIKTFASSPDHLKATEGETVVYKWKFKLARDFMVSSSFTHIHQIKAVGGPYESIPMISFTLRKGNPDRLELRYTSTNNQATIKTVDLDLLRGHWVEVTETIHFSNKGSYDVTINRVSNNASLFSYSNDAIDTWQDGATFSRPKWGIYRSLKQSNDIKDEIIRFANFSIEELGPLSLSDLEVQLEENELNLEASKGILNFKNVRANDYDHIDLYDTFGHIVAIENRLKKFKLDISGLNSGDYYLVFKKSKRSIKVLKFTI
ncbi:heparin lyase I family protein [Winogradskyella psychrotolerans]|uniref:heparin lyase I family protein n=1 Tax=Winogradskyella psychrotolerans TaxID=1344585 RepID=UPI001C06590B|nr:heparin lyase I family protein [Winogradskyella psychrotolerans]MBU2927967.1 heparin lyase I family protein [Winogradskyella psychrotolerans]